MYFLIEISYTLSEIETSFDIDKAFGICNRITSEVEFTIRR